MSRYVDVDKFIAYINSTSPLFFSDATRSELFRMLKEKSTSNASLIAHSHFDLVWKTDMFRNSKYWAYRCSECGATFLIEEADGWKYCPKCGAKIDKNE